jgi:hypothetical protein
MSRRKTPFRVPGEAHTESASTNHEEPPRTEAASPPMPPVSEKLTAIADEDPDEDKTGRKRKYTLSDTATAQRQAAAKKSTGPKTAEGKATSSRNALTHGMTAFKTSILVWGEDAVAYDELREALRLQYPPLDAIGDWAVRELANALWRQGRINLAEAASILYERDWISGFSSVLSHSGVPRSAQPKSWADCLHTAAGVEVLRDAIVASLDDIPSGIEDTDAGFWESFRVAAADFAPALPEFTHLVNAQATEASLTAWRQSVDLARARLDAREASLRRHEESRRATPSDISFVPMRDRMKLLIRYASMNDRKIEKLLKLIEKHCGQPAERDT